MENILEVYSFIFLFAGSQWLIYIISLIILLLLAYRGFNFYKKYKSTTFKVKQTEYLSSEKRRLIFELEKLKKENEKFREEIRLLRIQKDCDRNDQTSSDLSDSDKPNEQTWDNIDNKFPADTKRPFLESESSLIFFGSKTSDEREFLDITSELEQNKSIFKLVKTKSNPNFAEFEVILESDYIKRNVSNAPDHYLYKVCRPENSNQNFNKGIETVKKGIATYVEGKWIVKDGNLAIIKFF